MTHRLLLRAPRERQEELVAELWGLGTTGAEIGVDGDEERVFAYFDDSPEGKLSAALSRCGAELLAIDEVEDLDWLATYRERVEPGIVGPFWIDPREPSSDQPRDPELLPLRVPARNAFGTGSHESTVLALELLVELGAAGRRVLDVGCGSGILSFAALRLGASRAVGFDVDVPSVVTAQGYAALNALRPTFFAGTAEALGGTRFDLVLVNILPERWLAAAPAVAEALAPDGDLIVSGLLAEQADEVEAVLRGSGLSPAGRRLEGEWAALRLGA